MTDAEQIAALTSELSEALERANDARQKLDAFRVKCPTCRCRIMPNTMCQCCASTCESDDVESLL